MAYTVILDFEDEEAALNFVDAGLEGRLMFENDKDQFESSHPTVKGIYKRPTMFHFAHTTEAGDNRKRGTSWTKGQKWGWWVCAGCSYPSALYWRNIYKENEFGKNLLERLFDLETQV